MVDLDIIFKKLYADLETGKKNFLEILDTDSKDHGILLRTSTSESCYSRFTTTVRPGGHGRRRWLEGGSDVEEALVGEGRGAVEKVSERERETEREGAART